MKTIILEHRALAVIQKKRFTLRPSNSTHILSDQLSRLLNSDEIFGIIQVIFEAQAEINSSEGELYS
jgi:hypothetical protein